MSDRNEDASRVIPVGEARANLTRTLRGFRADPGGARAVVLGSHRQPEAVLMPYAQYRELSAGIGADRLGIAPALAELRRRRTLIERLGRANRIAGIRVFGSVARGDDGPDSDIDLLVDLEADASLFDLAQFEMDLESLLGRSVDVVSRRALDPETDAEILREAVEL